MKKSAIVCVMLLVGHASLVIGQTASLEDWSGAQWVWDQPNANQSEQSNDPRYVRCTFELPTSATQADLWVTADNLFTAYVNGVKVGAGSEWKTFQKIAVAPHLARGKNVLAIEARNQNGSAGVIARLFIKTAENKELRIVTNDRSKIVQHAPPDWQQLTFDDSKWPAASALGDAQIAPWRIAAGASRAGDGNPANSGNVSDVDPKITARLSAQEQQPHFVFPQGFEMELVAADPLVINPIALAIDDQGRIYVSESHTYRYGPKGSPVEPFTNPVVRLEPAADGKGWKRTLVAEGFDDPVMGIAVRGNKLWLSANNFLYQYDLADDGKASNRKTLLEDKHKAGNPFGMFVLEWGPDGLLYVSVGNHEIDIHGPDGELKSRGSSGVVMRMNPDGTKMERLAQGMRVPYSFEFDPFGQLWVLSNGEGNPNRFIRVIDGVDYHCFTRPVDNNWLTGKNPLAPPCFELLRGAHTQLMRYYGGAFPARYQGSLLLDNWGAHGFSGPNRAVFSYLPDERGNIVSKEPLLSCRDPHFRPSYIALDREGNLLVADWYGRDDESDMTGRIWRLKYTANDRPQSSHRLDSVDWARTSYVLSALGSPQHSIRAKAAGILLKQGNQPLPDLSQCAAGESGSSGKEALGAASALWTLVRIGTPESFAAISSGARHPDAKVRRLAVNLLRRYQMPAAAQVAEQLRSDPDPGVRIAAAIATGQAESIRTRLLEALSNGAAADPHLRYEAAARLAEYATAADFDKLLSCDDADLRLAGLVMIDFSCWENLSTKPLALAALNKALANPGALATDQLLELALANWDATLAPTLTALAGRDDLPLAVSAKAFLVLRQKAGDFAQALTASAGKRLLAAVKNGTVPITSPQDQIVVLELLEAGDPDEFAVRLVAQLIGYRDQNVRAAAHNLARKFGPQAASISKTLWPSLLDPKTRFEEAVEQLATVARVEAQPNLTNWDKLLAHPDRLLRSDAVRSLRASKGRAELIELLVRRAPDLIRDDPGIKDDLAAVFRELNAPEDSVLLLALPDAQQDKATLASQTLATVSAWSPEDRKQHAVLGQKVFERSNCVKCHTTATQTTLLAPSLKGIAAQKTEYLVESVLLPSQVIKTGFESETLVTKDGQSLSGLVKEEGDQFRVLSLDRDVRIPKRDVEERSVQRISIMPEGQEKQLSGRELADVIAFLMTLR